jgi:hypothetical protein
VFAAIPLVGLALTRKVAAPAVTPAEPAIAT